MNGVIVLNKPQGITSHDAVFKLRKLCGTKKVGHAGTLDPMATGVLPILIGNAVKASQYVCDSEKHYRARMLLGVETDTEDVTGTVKRRDGARPSYEEICRSAESFVGGYMQIPPMYSALKVNGKKLYELARANIEIPREPRKVQIYSVKVAPTDSPDSFDVEVSCSKGTYIRTFLTDIAARAGALCAMSALERTFCGGFSLGDSYTLDQLEEAKVAGKLSELLVPTERLFRSYRELRLGDFYLRLALNGQVIYSKRARIPAGEPGEKIRVANENGAFCALGEWILTEEGPAVKTLKQFPASES